jgi:uncharacterized protein
MPPVNGETNLTTVLKDLKPTLQSGEYVFCSLSLDQLPPSVEPLGLFQESEGITLIVPKHQADQLGLAYSYVAAWITLTVHSSLAAVGLTAAVSQALAAENISCNVVAAYYHDHLFVGVQDAQRAIEILTALSHNHGR